MAGFKRYDPTVIHWKLIEQRKAYEHLDARVWDDGWVQAQALFCPYYAVLEGRLGFDWGVIVNPESLKFGQVVFEHEWCGCPGEDGPFDSDPSHGGGKQIVDEWAKPKRRKPRRADEVGE
jgi:hypothetical protein